MSVHVTLGLGRGGPVAIKTATGAASVDRLRGEAQRLRRAGHPGVVTVVSCGPVGEAFELRTRYAGDALGRWTGSFAHAAGLCAAIGATLADLHEVGLVHGRLDATHVLVGADGRPRLCGLAPPGEADPADDVQALGLLLEHLLGRVGTERRGALGWPRSAGSGAARRALSQIAARALDPVAARRPPARALARSILAAIPGAELPPPSAPSSVSGGADGLGAWLARATASPPAAGTRRSPVDETAGDVPAAVAFTPGARPGDGERVAGTVDAAIAPVGADNGVGADGANPGSSNPNDPDATPAEALTWPHGSEPSSTAEPRAGRTGPDWGTPVASGGAADHDAATAPGADLHQLDELAWSDDGRGDEPPITAPVRAVAGRSPLPRLGETRFRADAPDDARRRRRPPARPGPGPHRRGQAPARRGTVLRVGSACVVGLTLVAGGTIVTRSDTGDDPSSPAPAGAGPAGPGPCAAHVTPGADVDGDGCPEQVRVEGRIVEAGGVRWSLGEAGDVAAVGDWDCDGSASPALLRPGTGDVFVFSRWASAHEPLTVDALDSVGGGTGIRARRGSDGCDTLVIERPAGDVTLEVDG